MLKIAISFIAGIIFTAIALYVLFNYQSWLPGNSLKCEIKNISPLGVNGTSLYIESNTYDGGKEASGSIHSINLNDQKENWKYSFKGFYGNKLYLHINSVILQNFTELKSIDANTGKLLWSKNLESRPHSSYRCGENLIFIDQKRLYSFGLAKQDILWSNDLENKMVTGCYCTDREIYYTTNEGILYCLSVDTGQEIWQKPIFNEE